jgi:hypothetical protein
MPRGDQTGPMGMGRMTGRGAGYCAAFGQRGYSEPSPWQDFKNTFRSRLAWGGGFGGGQRWRVHSSAASLPWWMHFSGCALPRRYQKPDPETERQMLEHQARILKEELESIEKRLAMIGKDAQEPPA